MVIHFFKNRSKERIDFVELIDGYFDLLDHCHIESTEEEVKITIDLVEFNCSYEYLITKRSRVSSIYKLNSEYININLLCEIPEAIPQYVMRVILKQIDELCKKFELEIYHDQVCNIVEFKLFDVLQILIKKRNNKIAENSEIKVYKVPEHVLNQVCLYQLIHEKLPTIVGQDLVPGSYLPLVDKLTKHVEFAINWKVDVPIVFPPQLSFIQVEEEENLIALIPSDIFFKYATRFTYEIKDNVVDLKMLYLDEKGCQKVKKLLRKMRKHMISISNYEVINLTNLVEE